MGTMEVFLIMAGVVLLGLSFVIKEQRSTDSENQIGQADVRNIAQDIVKEEIQNRLSEISDDVYENAEARLDKLANQKIMAVGNYSEDVLKNIKDNHNEVMFLYNMLNDKETTLKNTVRDIEAVKVSVKKMSESIPNESELSAQNNESGQDFEQGAGGNITGNKGSDQNFGGNRTAEREEKSGGGQAEAFILRENGKAVENGNSGRDTQRNTQKNASNKRNRRHNNNRDNSDSSRDMNGNKTENPKNVENGKGSNKERILELYHQGKTNVEIAKELNLGVGEVNLVLGLFK